MTKNDNESTPDELTSTHDSDQFLRTLVHLANSLNIEFAITLSVSGQTICGTIISGKRYFEEFAETFSKGWNGDSSETVREGFIRNADIYDSNSAAAKQYQESYIHLADARFYSSSGMVPSQGGVLWRGKVSAVSGFNMGALSQD